MTEQNNTDITVKKDYHDVYYCLPSILQEIEVSERHRAYTFVLCHIVDNMLFIKQAIKNDIPYIYVAKAIKSLIRFVIAHEVTDDFGVENVLDSVATIATFGRNKHKDDNIDYRKHKSIKDEVDYWTSKVIRHAKAAYIDFTEALDPETREPHAMHLICDLCLLLEHLDHSYAIYHTP